MKTREELEHDILNRTASIDEVRSHPDWEVRALAVVEQLQPETFAEDPNWLVRWEVAGHGEWAEVLLDDPEPWVRKAAVETLVSIEWGINREVERGIDF